MYMQVSKNDADEGIQRMAVSSGPRTGERSLVERISSNKLALAGFTVVAMFTVVTIGTAGNLATTVPVTSKPVALDAASETQSSSAASPKVEFDADKFHEDYLVQPAFSDFWEDSRSVLSHAGALEPARQKWRDMIWKNQNPDDCETARLCHCRTQHGGFFSHMHSRATCLVYAVVEGCTWIDATAPPKKIGGPVSYVNKRKCSMKGRASYFECYYQPISKCNNRALAKKRDSEIEALVTIQRCPIFEQRFQTILAKTGLTSRLLVMSEVMAYMMRPQQRLKDSVDLWSKRLGLYNQAILRNTLSVHIRHGDKRGVDKEEKHHTRMVGMSNELRKMYGYEKIHYMTDDPHSGKVLELIGKDYSNVEVTHIPFMEFPSVKEALKKSKVRDNVNTTVDQVSENDEGLLLITQVILMAQGSMLLGTQISNVDRAILELMAAVKYPPETYDTYGDTYIPCASGEEHHDWVGKSQRFWDEDEGKATSEIDRLEGQGIAGEEAKVDTPKGGATP